MTPPSYLPDGYRSIGQPTLITLARAYLPPGSLLGLDASITNAPDWVTSERYDIDARIADKDLRAWGSQLSHEDDHHVYLRAALRNLLKERYKLQAHLVNTQVPYLSIVVNKDHNKLVAVQEIPPAPEGAMSRPLPSGGYVTQTTRDQDGNITMKFFGCTMDDLASAITRQLVQLTQNKTGLKGRYNFQFTATAHEMVEDIQSSTGFAKLGLRLQSDKGPGYNLVIDHIERPDAN
jgi:uncharacterized protein (TIGR03435 family)